MRRLSTTLALIATLTIAATALASPPEVLNVSGRLTTADGEFTGTVDATFALYDHADAVDPAHLLWSGTDVIDVAAGRFHTLLGADFDNPLPIELFWHDELFLGVTLGSDSELTPRLRLASVPWAIRALDAETLDGHGPSDFSLTGHEHAELYYMEGEVDALLASKSDVGHAHDGAYYRRADVDAAVATRAAVVHGHDDLYFLRTEIDALLAAKADAVHAHDDTYYSKTLTDDLLAGKADLLHDHDERYSRTEDLATVALSGSYTDLVDTPNPSGYVRTVVVSPVGTPEENGAALRSAISGIDDASEANPYLVHIEPGIYELTSGGLNCKDYVDVEGSGQSVTIIRGSHSPSSHLYAMVYLADYMELRHVTVISEGRATTWLDYSTAINIRRIGARLLHVTAIARGPDSATGVFVGWSGEGPPVLEHVTALGEGDRYNRGMMLWGGGAEVRDSVFRAVEGITDSYGIAAVNANPAHLLTIHNCQLAGETNALRSDADYDTRVALSQLDGGVRPGGTVVCAGVYDGSHAFHASSCP